MRIIGLIPAYNEEAMIAEVVKKTLEFVDQVIVIDDGSHDATFAIAQQAGAYVIRNRKNLGLGRTMRKGYIQARKLGADIIVQLDADMQYDPKEIPLLIDPIIQDRADLVLGSRLDNIMYDMPPLKRFGNKSFSWVLSKFTKQRIFDGQTGFRAIRGELLDCILPINKFSYTQEMILRTAFEGWRISCVPVHFYQRYDGKSRLFKSTFGFAIRGWTIILKTVRDYYPMKFFGYPGILLMAVSFSWYALHILNEIFTWGIDWFTPLGSAVLLLLGTQLIIAALISDMFTKKK